MTTTRIMKDIKPENSAEQYLTRFGNDALKEAVLNDMPIELILELYESNKCSKNEIDHHPYNDPSIKDVINCEVSGFHFKVRSSDDLLKAMDQRWWLAELAMRKARFDILEYLDKEGLPLRNPFYARCKAIGFYTVFKACQAVNQKAVDWLLNEHFYDVNLDEMGIIIGWPHNFHGLFDRYRKPLIHYWLNYVLDRIRNDNDRYSYLLNSNHRWFLSNVSSEIDHENALVMSRIMEEYFNKKEYLIGDSKMQHCYIMLLNLMGELSVRARQSFHIHQLLSHDLISEAVDYCQNLIAKDSANSPAKIALAEMIFTGLIELDEPNSPLETALKDQPTIKKAMQALYMLNDCEKEADKFAQRMQQYMTSYDVNAVPNKSITIDDWHPEFKSLYLTYLLHKECDSHKYDAIVNSFIKTWQMPKGHENKSVQTDDIPIVNNNEVSFRI